MAKELIRWARTREEVAILCTGISNIPAKNARLDDPWLNEGIPASNIQAIEGSLSDTKVFHARRLDLTILNMWIKQVVPNGTTFVRGENSRGDNDERTTRGEDGGPGLGLEMAMAAGEVIVPAPVDP
jgi:hypothetical protein